MEVVRQILATASVHSGSEGAELSDWSCSTFDSDTGLDANPKPDALVLEYSFQSGGERDHQHDRLVLQDVRYDISLKNVLWAYIAEELCHACIVSNSYTSLKAVALCETIVSL